VEEVRTYLRHEEGERRARATELMGVLLGVEAVGDVLPMLADPEPRVRIAAARTLEQLSPRELPVELEGAGMEGDAPTVLRTPLSARNWRHQVLRRLEQESDAAVIEALTGVLVRERESALVPLLQVWLENPRVFQASERREMLNDGLPRTPFPGSPGQVSLGVPLQHPLPLRALSALALEELQAWEAIPQLGRLVEDPDPDVRRAVAWSLASLTNREWPDGSDAAALAKSWKSWEKAGVAGGTQLLETGFSHAGYPVRSLDRGAVPVLVRALNGPPPVALNAHRQLERLTGQHPDRDAYCELDSLRGFWNGLEGPVGTAHGRSQRTGEAAN
jgi:HEAT repeat protein